jgi:hypothetical protein
LEDFAVKRLMLVAWSVAFSLSLSGCSRPPADAASVVTESRESDDVPPGLVVGSKVNFYMGAENGEFFYSRSVFAEMGFAPSPLAPMDFVVTKIHGRWVQIEGEGDENGINGWYNMDNVMICNFTE